MSGEEDEKFGTTNLIILGIYGHKYPFGISKIGNGQVVVVMEDNEEYVLAESLCELFTKLKVANPQLGLLNNSLFCLLSYILHSIIKYLLLLHKY